MRVGIGFEIAKRQVLEFPFELPNAEPVREWCVYLLGLGGECAFLGAICAFCEP